MIFRREDPETAVPQPNRERARIWYAPRSTCGRCPSLMKHVRTARACSKASEASYRSIGATRDQPAIGARDQPAVGARR